MRTRRCPRRSWNPRKRCTAWRCTSSRSLAELVGTGALLFLPSCASGGPPAGDPPVWGEGEGKSYWIPAADIVGFDLLLNRFDRQFMDEDDFDTSFSSISHNIQDGWEIDEDTFAMNQLGHPYQGSMYHGFARSAGLDYWTALLYDLGGSTLWEIAGETTSPSINDQITTTFGGSFLGEALFRMASLVLEENAAKPGFWRELSAALISPATGFNRLAYGERFDGVYASRRAATYLHAGVGARRLAHLDDFVDVEDAASGEGVLGVSMDYGLPGRAGYDYSKPFDYFHFEAALTSSSNSIPENVMVRGLLYGSDYESGDSYRGIWGLYGSYDYISPELFSVSSSALSLGTTAEWWWSDWAALQGTCLAGVGWTAVGTIADAADDRDYRYGYSPQALVELRFVMGDIAVLEVSGREYWIDGTSSDAAPDSETIARGQASLTVRVYGHHALAVQFVASSRDAGIPDLPDTFQSVGALSLFYTYVSDTKLGAVGWD